MHEVPPTIAQAHDALTEYLLGMDNDYKRPQLMDGKVAPLRRVVVAALLIVHANMRRKVKFRRRSWVWYQTMKAAALRLRDFDPNRDDSMWHWSEEQHGMIAEANSAWDLERSR